MVSVSCWLGVGLVVDSVPEAVRIEERDISSFGPGSGGGADFAVGRVGEKKLVLLLDLNRILGGLELMAKVE